MLPALNTTRGEEEGRKGGRRKGRGGMLLMSQIALLLVLQM